MLTKKLATYRGIDVLGKIVHLLPPPNPDTNWEPLITNRMINIIAFLEKEEIYKNSQLSTDDLAKHISISSRQLQRSMSTFLGCSFTDLLSAIRMKKALELLQKGTRPSVVAFEVGFNSYPYFSRLFGKTFHITPDDYKKGCAAEQLIDTNKHIAIGIQALLAPYRGIDVLGKTVDLLPQMKLDAKWDQLMVERITMIINFLKEAKNYRNSQLSIDDLAKHISISSRQLQRSMSTFLGCSFTDLLRAIRMKKALELLQKGTRPSVVAFEVGVNSHPYFSRLFGETFHITPDEYRRGYAAAKSSSPLATDYSLCSKEVCQKALIYF